MKFPGTVLFMSVAYLASLISAQGEAPIVSITSPLANTHYKAGSEAIISWTNPLVGTIDQIVLAKGKSNALVPLRTIATNVSAADMKYVWKIPFEIDNADDYAFELGTSPKLAFAGPFTIEGGVGVSASGATSNTNASPPGSPAVAAAPGSNVAATPAAPSSSSTGSNSQTSPHNASTSHSSAAIKQNAGQAVVALGMVAVFASQFF